MRANMKFKQVRQWGPLSTHADSTSSDILQRCAWSARWPFRRPILSFWGSKVHKNGRLPAWEADKLPCKIRNRTNKQRNKHKNSSLYTHTLPIGMCG